MSIKCKEIINQLEKLAPLQYAENWDNVGLLIGHHDKQVKKIMLALDPSKDIVTEAVDNDVDMLITHHPMLFKPISKITDENFISQKALMLIENKIAYYAMHTNYDTVGSLGEVLADKLGLTNTRPLHVTKEEVLVKFIVYVPLDYVDQVRDAICEADAGFIGNYSHCTFNTTGTGTFLPGENTNPFIGEHGKLSQVNEIKIETVVSKHKLQATINNMMKVHPYEEPAYDLILLQNKGKKEGLGKIGWIEEKSLSEYALIIKRNLNLDDLRVYGPLDKPIKSVASCSGSGKQFVKDAIAQKADVYITGDIDHHTALDCIEQGLAVIDIGHYGSEHIFSEAIFMYLNAIYGSEVELVIGKERNPYTTL